MLAASLLLALSAPGQVALDPRPLPMVDGWPGAVALRLVDDGYRVVPLAEDAEVVVRLFPHEGGLRLEAESYLARRSEVIPASDDPEVLAFEVLQRASVLVDELGALPDRQTEGLPRGVALQVEGDDPEVAGRAAEALATSLLRAGWALTPAPRPGDRSLCVAVRRDEVTLRTGEALCTAPRSAVPPLPGDVVTAAAVGLLHEPDPASPAVTRKRAAPRGQGLPPAPREGAYGSLRSSVGLTLGATAGTVATLPMLSPMLGVRVDASMGAATGLQLAGRLQLGQPTTLGAGPSLSAALPGGLFLRGGALGFVGATAAPVIGDTTLVPALIAGVELPVSLGFRLVGLEASMTVFLQSGIGVATVTPQHPADSSVGLYGLMPALHYGAGFAFSLGFHHLFGAEPDLPPRRQL